MNLIRTEEEDHHVVHLETRRDIDQGDHHLMAEGHHLIVGGVCLIVGDHNLIEGGHPLIGRDHHLTLEGDHHLTGRRVMIERGKVIVQEDKGRDTVVVSVVGVIAESSVDSIFRSVYDKQSRSRSRQKYSKINE